MPLRSTPKKDAVLAIGLDKPTPEIIAAAKDRGVTVSGTYVDLLKKGKTGGKAKSKAPAKSAAKSSSKAAKAAPKKAAPKAAKTASKKAAPKKAPKSASKKPSLSAAGPVSKSAFIRAMPGASAAEIVAAAKAKGLEFSEKYVSTIRYNQKAAKKKKGPSAGSAPKAAAAPKRGPGRPPKSAGKGASKVIKAPAKVLAPVHTGGASEKALRGAIFSFVLQHGLPSVKHIVDDVAAKILASGPR